MKTIRFLFILIAATLVIAGTAEAQKTRRSTPKRPAVTPTPRPTPIPMDVRLAKETVSNQRVNVNLFVDKVAPIAVSIETVDREAKTTRLKKELFDSNEANKKKLVDAFRNMRVGLVNLENEFRSKPNLRKYLPQIEGIAALSTEAEDAALAGRFVDARKPLVTVAAKLSDTLAVMPGPPVSLTNTPPTRTTTLRVGMTQQDALAAWGQPQNKRRTGKAPRITEVWVYPNQRSLYFVNGKLTNISQ